MVYDISYKALIGSKHLHVRFGRIDEFIIIYDETRYSKLLGSEKCYAIYHKMRYIVISKSVKTKTSSKYLIEYLHKDIIPLVSIMAKMSGYIKTLKVKDGDKDKSNKLMLSV